MVKIRILVVDDHTLIRQAIVGLLNVQPDMQVVGEGGNGEEALEKTAQLNPDIVLMDIGMSGMNGLDATSHISKEYPKTKVLILTMHDREDYFFQALRAGAAGYVLKGADSHDLLSAVRSVHKGEVYLYPTVTKKLLADYMRRIENGDGRADYYGLTDREREVLKLIAQGNTTVEIAKLLFISPHTVQAHKDKLMEKLQLRRKAELIRYAIDKGLVDSDK